MLCYQQLKHVSAIITLFACSGIGVLLKSEARLSYNHAFYMLCYQQLKHVSAIIILFACSGIGVLLKSEARLSYNHTFLHALLSKSEARLSHNQTFCMFCDGFRNAEAWAQNREPPKVTTRALLARYFLAQRASGWPNGRNGWFSRGRDGGFSPSAGAPPSPPSPAQQHCAIACATTLYDLCATAMCEHIVRTHCANRGGIHHWEPPVGNMETQQVRTGRSSVLTKYEPVASRSGPRFQQFPVIWGSLVTPARSQKYEALVSNSWEDPHAPCPFWYRK